MGLSCSEIGPELLYYSSLQNPTWELCFFLLLSKFIWVQRFKKKIYRKSFILKSQTLVKSELLVITHRLYRPLLTYYNLGKAIVSGLILHLLYWPHSWFTVSEGCCPVTYIIAVIADASPGSLPEHQQVHLCLYRTGAAQRLPAPICRLSWVRVPGGKKYNTSLVSLLQLLLMALRSFSSPLTSMFRVVWCSV